MERKPVDKFAYLQVGKGHVTLSLRVHNDVVQVGAAFCSPNDQMNKAKGRMIALGRREKNSAFSFEYVRNKNTNFLKQLQDTFYAFAANQPDMPNWVRKGIRRPTGFNHSKDVRMSDACCLR